MDQISQLLQEARPLYLRRKKMRKMIKGPCLLGIVLVFAAPTVISSWRNHVAPQALYAELYGVDTLNHDFYIDEFDAIGII